MSRRFYGEILRHFYIVRTLPGDALDQPAFQRPHQKDIGVAGEFLHISEVILRRYALRRVELSGRPWKVVRRQGRQRTMLYAFMISDSFMFLLNLASTHTIHS